MLHSLKSCNSNELQDFLLLPFADFFVLLLILLTDYKNYSNSIFSLIINNLPMAAVTTADVFDIGD